MDGQARPRFQPAPEAPPPPPCRPGPGSRASVRPTRVPRSRRISHAVNARAAGAESAKNDPCAGHRRHAPSPETPHNGQYTGQRNASAPRPTDSSFKRDHQTDEPAPANGNADARSNATATVALQLPVISLAIRTEASLPKPVLTAIERGASAPAPARLHRSAPAPAAIESAGAAAGSKPGTRGALAPHPPPRSPASRRPQPAHRPQPSRPLSEDPGGCHAADGRPMAPQYRPMCFRRDG